MKNAKVPLPEKKVLLAPLFSSWTESPGARPEMVPPMVKDPIVQLTTTFVTLALFTVPLPAEMLHMPPVGCVPTVTA